MLTTLRQTLTHSIQAKLIAMTGAIVMSMFFIMTCVIALIAANILDQQSSRQLSQSVEQSAALLSNFLDARDTNLNLWATNPLVEAVSTDPDMFPIFAPSLNKYFAEIKKQEPWIEHIFIIRDKSVVYDNSNIFLFSDGNNGTPNGINNLLALSDKGISILDLQQLTTQQNKPILVLKRVIGKQGLSNADTYIVLVLNFDFINQKLFGQIQIGERGFISIVGKTNNSKIVVSPQIRPITEEKDDFMETSRTWRAFSEVPNRYQSITLKIQALGAHPFAMVGVASLNDTRQPIRNLIYFSGIFGLAALALGIWSAIILSKRLTGPIMKLTIKAEQLALDHAAVPNGAARTKLANHPTTSSTTNSTTSPTTQDEQNFLEINSKDELGRLALSFARMQNAIHEKIDVIETQNEKLKKNDLLKEELNQSLEHKVEKRTQQLQAALSTQKTISNALEDKSQALNHSYKQLELRTLALSETNQTLEDTLHDLRATHSLLIQSEKMASLGQLVANVAHEINNPIGAVKSSGENISDALNQVLESMPLLFQVLDQSNRALFTSLITQAKKQYTILNSREERSIATQVMRELEQAGIEQPRHRAAILVQLRAHQIIAEWLPLLRHPQCNMILVTALGIATIITNTVNINIAVERVAKIVFALKSFSRTNPSGKRIEANLQEGIETVLTIYQNQIRQGTELIRNYETIPPLFCLPDELNQVWTNLIHNALQAMKHQGTLTVGIRQTEDTAVISIGDSGCGIPPEIRDKVFNAFFTTKPTGEGSGLGLDIVKKIIDKHNGRIDFESEVGVGTTFSVYLPYRSK